jgi:ADP-ribosylglycohydrolase
MVRNKVLGGLFGLCVGDALGVPVEGIPRSVLKERPVTGMLGYGSHNQPPGTWSDDSSLAFCLAESLCGGLDLQDIADKFCKWWYDAHWTPHGATFDGGYTTIEAISRLKSGVNPIEAGSTGEFSNGNGSLMRILPLAFHLEHSDPIHQFSVTHQVSCLTHGHVRSQMACGIYIQIAINILKGKNPRTAYEDARDTTLEFYAMPPYDSELHHFDRVVRSDISAPPEASISSSGYVVDTLEASLWCVLNYDSYSDTVLAAVNLGGDTDTTGAVAGGLAGLYHGFESIPEKWRNQLARKDDIIGLAQKLSAAIHGE